MRGASRPNLVRAAALPLLCLAACTGADQRSTGNEETEPAPAYSALTLAGDSVSLEDERGSAVLLNIWATWCEPCREEIPMLQRLHETEGPKGLRVIGVSIDAAGEEERIRRFLAGYGVTYPVWIDPEHDVGMRFNTIGVPATYLIDREGRIVWKHLGPFKANDPALRAALEKALKLD